MPPNRIVRLQSLIREIRLKLLSVEPKARRTTVEGIPDIRAEVAGKLAAAISDVEAIARSSAKRTRKGSGGVAPKARWYQLMADLAQVLDGVLRSASASEIETKLEHLESSVDELQGQSSTSGG